MNHFIKGICYELAGRVDKMEEALLKPDICEDIDKDFFLETLKMLHLVRREILQLIASGDIEIEELSANNIIKYNTYYEQLMNIELFRYLIIIGYGDAEIYFRKQVRRIYDEIGCLQKPPLITTISNSENYYWALPIYDVIAVPTGEERNLLNLPDLFHEIGHLIEKQYANFLQGDITFSINNYYQLEIQRVQLEERAISLIPFFQEKHLHWAGSWIMEFTCDLIATYLAGPAYSWTNMKLTTLSSSKDRVYKDSPTHPSDESRMRAIFYLLHQLGHTAELSNLQSSWNSFLKITGNAVPANYDYIFPQHLLEELADNVLKGCIDIGLRSYSDQVVKFANPVSKLLNDAWQELLSRPETFKDWEREGIEQMNFSLR